MRDGPRRFPQNSSCSAVLRCRLARIHGFRVRGCHPLRPRFPACSPIRQRARWRRSYNPGRGHTDRPGLGCCAFARHYLRNHFCFLFLRVLRCFSSPRSPRAAFRAVPGSLPAGSPIRTSADRRAFAPPRGFSQLVTSFVASESHRHPPCALPCFLCFFRSQDLRSRVRSSLDSSSLLLATRFRSSLSVLRVPSMSMNPFRP